MKRKAFYFFAFCLAVITMISCGNKKKLQQFAEQFAGYVNSDQIDSIKAVYPTLNFDSFSTIEPDSIQVSETGDNLYRIDFAGGKWIEVKMNEDGNIIVLESKGIASFPEEKYEIAVNTGMLNDTTMDVRAHDLLNDEAYFEWVKKIMKQPIGLEKGKINKRYGVDLRGRSFEGSSERITCTVINNTSKPISGKDYDITYSYSYETCSDGSSPPAHASGKKNGVDLAPGESAPINLGINGFGLSNVNVRYNVPVEQLYNGMNPYTGNEYQQYLKESSSDVNYDWLSTREATSKDLANKSKEELRIMRNWIFARHGYIFKSADLAEYFGKFPWYEPTNKDVTSKLNKIEQANVALIQGHE